MLTTSVDMGSAFVGTEKGDLFTAHYDAQAINKVHTLSAFDELDGGAGKDTLKITSDDTTAYTMADATIKNIETITIKGANNVTADVAGSNIIGLETISVLKSVDAEVHANSTTDVNVSGAKGTIDVSGGKNVVVNDATADKAITIGQTSDIGAAPTDVTETNATGTITVTDTKLGTGKIDIDGGTDVTVTATADKADAGKITVGAFKAATGDVKIVSNTTSDSTDVTAGDVTVTGGKTVEITANMTNTAVKAGDGVDITAGTYKVTAGDTTTDVTITQNATAIDFENDAAAATFETAVVTFGALKAGESVAISYGTQNINVIHTTASDDLTFTASKDLTAAEVAAAFANLTNTTNTQSATGITANGYFTGELDAGWTSGAVSGNTVTFTATTAGAQTNDIEVNTNKTNDWSSVVAATANVDFKVDVTQGVDAALATDVDVNADLGAVVVDDNATKSITTITLDGFDGATLGATPITGSLDKLATLNLANGTGITALTSTVATLNVTLDDIAGALDLGTNSAITTLNLVVDGDSTFNITDVATTLNITANANLNTSADTFDAVKTATITGAGNVTLGDISTALETLTASAATGDISATVAGDKATVTTGAGHDSITVKGATVTNAITLGNGTDTLTLTELNDLTDLAAIAGGAGIDTVVLAATHANVATGLSFLGTSNIFKSKVTGFEKLEIFNNLVAATGTVNVGNLGYNYVITNAISAKVLTLAGMENKGTVELNAAEAGTTDKVIVEVKNADTGATDVLDVVLKTTSPSEDAGTLEVDDVETINISTVGLDFSTELILDATSAKTVTVAGDADLTLDMTGNTAATLIDGSKMTGDLTVTAFNSDMTVKGGDGNDTLSVDNTSTSSSMTGVVLTGGKGTDTFDVSKFDSFGNPGSAVTITDLTAGETIKFAVVGAGAEKFVSAKVTLIAEATFTEYVAKAAEIADPAGTGTNNIAWFQFNNNTFIVQDAGTTGGEFDAGDIIVKINGVKDLSTASFNATDGTLEIA